MQLVFQHPHTRRTKTAHLVIHHSAGQDVSAAVIHQQHLQRGYNGIGYHYLIRKNGALEAGRPETAVGAHAKGYNYDSIGICLTGNFMQEPPAPAQLATLRGLITKLQRTYGNLTINLHRELNATACPGIYFTRDLLTGGPAGQNTSDFRQQLMIWAQEHGWTQELHPPNEPSPKWFIIAVLKNMQAQSTD